MQGPEFKPQQCQKMNTVCQQSDNVGSLYFPVKFSKIAVKNKVYWGKRSGGRFIPVFPDD
jgi:hypothetical protein